jgi:hypothetical protein
MDACRQASSAICQEAQNSCISCTWQPCKEDNLLRKRTPLSDVLIHISPLRSYQAFLSSVHSLTYQMFGQREHVPGSRVLKHLSTCLLHNQASLTLVESILKTSMDPHLIYQTSQDMCTLPVSPRIWRSGYFNPCSLFIYLSLVTATSSVGLTEAPTSLVALLISLAVDSNFIYSFLFWPGYTSLQPPPDS